MRAGIHAGECERIGGKLGGMSVLVGAAGEVLVSRTVRDLVAGSGIALEDRGERRLRALPEAWRL